jgi:hypothetical protein
MRILKRSGIIFMLPYWRPVRKYLEDRPTRKIGSLTKLGKGLRNSKKSRVNYCKPTTKMRK